MLSRFSQIILCTLKGKIFLFDKTGLMKMYGISFFLNFFETLSQKLVNQVLHKKILRYKMNYLFFHSILLRENVFILKRFILIYNQLSSTANAKDINADFYLYFSFNVSLISSIEVEKETRKK